MPLTYPSIPQHLQKWAMEQPMFFTATAPLHGNHINVSPKGVPGKTFKIINGNRAIYLDMAGSGSETVSHIYENGRVTLMFCSFDANIPRIVRLYCVGHITEFDNPNFGSMLEGIGLEKVPGMRAIVVLDIWKVCSIIHTFV